jgi:hypothetical protein
MSKDNGATWTDPVNVFSDSIGAFLGPSIAITAKGEVAVSVGSYGGRNILFAKKRQDGSGISFQQPTIVGKVSKTLASAMSELSCFKNGLMMTWQNPHQRSETWMAFSKDDGATWSEPHMVNSFGNLLSSVFDEKGYIHCIYSDFSEQKYSVGYKMMNEKMEVLKTDYVSPPKPLSTFSEYLGAYQKLLISKKELLAWWIDYPEESTLKFSKWKF